MTINNANLLPNLDIEYGVSSAQAIEPKVFRNANLLSDLQVEFATSSAQPLFPIFRTTSLLPDLNVEFAHASAQQPVPVVCRSASLLPSVFILPITPGDNSIEFSFVLNNVVADFTGSPLTGRLPLSVSFTDLSTGDPNEWTWDFGDLTPVSHEQNPTHIYVSTGLFAVTLTIKNPLYENTIVKTNYIQVLTSPFFIDAGIGGDLPYPGSYTNFHSFLATGMLLDGDIIEVIDNGIIDDSETSVLTFDKNVIIRSHVSNINKPEVHTGGTFYFDGIDAEINSIKFKLVGNIFSEIIYAGWGGASSCIVDSCEFYKDSGNFTAINIEVYSAGIIRNCISYAGYLNIAYGHYAEFVNNISFSAFTAIEAQTINKFVAINNSIVNATYGIIYLGTLPVENSLILNNIINGDSNSGTVGIYLDGDYSLVTQNYNCVYDFTDLYYNTSKGVNGIELDPKFISSSDLRLQDSSQCIDAGIDADTYPEIPNYAINGASRPQGLLFDMGAYERAKVTTKKLLVVQRHKHVAKLLNSDIIPAVYANKVYGEFNKLGTVNRLKYPTSTTHNSTNIFICDNKNNRIIKLDNDYAFISEYSTANTIGLPLAIFYNGTQLVAVGSRQQYIRVEKLDTDLNSLLVSNNLSLYNFRLASICQQSSLTCVVTGFTTGYYILTHNGTITLSEQRFLTGQTEQEHNEPWTNATLTIQKTHYNSVIKHTNGFYYFNNSTQLIKTTSNFAVSGLSKKQKSIVGLKEGSNQTLLTFDRRNNKLLRFDRNLNHIEDVYLNTGDVLATNAYDIIDFIEYT